MTAREISDRLSPIVVKELRQGVRGHLFTGAYLLVQLLLLLLVTLALLLEWMDSPRNEFSFFFWAVITVPMLVVLPLGAGLSLSGEVTAHTLEPVLLTRLTAWRVVAGKWAATAGQTLVLVVSLLPFLLVRYYLGTVEVAAELTFLVGYLACSLLLSALCVAVSAAPLSALFRWILTAAAGLPLAITFLTSVGQTVFNPMMSPKAAEVAAAALVALVALLCALEAGALQVAPVALARPARLRLLALVALGLAAWFATQGATPFQVVGIGWGIVLGAVVAVAAVCERAPLLPTRYAPFFERRAGRLFAYVLAPGWPAGVGFACVLALAAGAVTLAVEGPRHAAYVVGGIAGTLLMPVAVARSLFPRARPFLVLLLVSLLSWALTVLAPVALAMDSPDLWAVGAVLLAVCPSAYALARLQFFGDYGKYPTTQIPPAADAVFAAVVTIATVIALVHAMRAWRDVHRLFAPAPRT